MSNFRIGNVQEARMSFTKELMIISSQSTVYTAIPVQNTEKSPFSRSWAAPGHMCPAQHTMQGASVRQLQGLLQGFREQWSHLVEGPQTVQAFMWQENLIDVATKLSTRAWTR